MSLVEMVSLRHAVENACGVTVSDAGLIAMLEGKGGSGAELRALFEDCSLRALARAGAAAGLGLESVLASYAAARVSAAAVNTELDAALNGGW